jgi:hypothetical protein
MRNSLSVGWHLVQAGRPDPSLLRSPWRAFHFYLSMIGAGDKEAHSHLELMDALRQCGAAPGTEGPELWRRIVFSVLISNIDDHLRNHGFLYEGPKG